MSDRLVTVATFDLAPEAQAARNALEESGIRASLADEATVSMVWEIANALGGIKVQVQESDVERALKVLGHDADVLDREVNPEDFAEEAESASSENEEREVFEGPTPAVMEAAADAIGSREHDARRLFFIAWFGLLFPPIAFYALYSFLCTAYGKGELSSRGRFHLSVGGGMTAIGLLMCYLVLLAIMQR